MGLGFRPRFGPSRSGPAECTPTKCRQLSVRPPEAEPCTPPVRPDHPSSPSPPLSSFHTNAHLPPSPVRRLRWCCQHRAGVFMSEAPRRVAPCRSEPPIRIPRASWRLLGPALAGTFSGQLQLGHFGQICLFRILRKKVIYPNSPVISNSCREILRIGCLRFRLKTPQKVHYSRFPLWANTKDLP